MTGLDTVEPKDVVEVEASGHDVLDLLYHLLDEFLFSFGTEFIVVYGIGSPLRNSVEIGNGGEKKKNSSYAASSI